MDRLNETVAMLQAGGIAVYPLVALAVVAVVIAIEKCFVLSVRTHLPAHIIGMRTGSRASWTRWSATRLIDHIRLDATLPGPP